MGPRDELPVARQLEPGIRDAGPIDPRVCRCDDIRAHRRCRAWQIASEVLVADRPQERAARDEGLPERRERRPPQRRVEARGALQHRPVERVDEDPLPHARVADLRDDRLDELLSASHVTRVVGNALHLDGVPRVRPARLDSGKHLGQQRNPRTGHRLLARVCRQRPAPHIDRAELVEGELIDPGPDEVRPLAGDLVGEEDRVVPHDGIPIRGEQDVELDAGASLAHRFDEALDGVLDDETPGPSVALDVDPIP